MKKFLKQLFCIHSYITPPFTSGYIKECEKCDHLKLERAKLKEVAK